MEPADPLEEPLAEREVVRRTDPERVPGRLVARVEARATGEQLIARFGLVVLVPVPLLGTTAVVVVEPTACAVVRAEREETVGRNNPPTDAADDEVCSAREEAIVRDRVRTGERRGMLPAPKAGGG